MRPSLALFVFIIMACAPAFAFAEDSTAGGVESSIKKHFKDFDQAWSRHDAKAVAAFYTEKGEIVTESGQTFSGREGIEQILSEGFDNTLKDSTLTVTVQKIRLIKPDVALVDSDLQIKQADSDPSMLHLFTLLVNQDGKWMVETSRAVAYK